MVAAGTEMVAVLLRTPCCNAPFKAYYRYDGPPYLTEKNVDGYLCLGEGCWNEWSEEGEPIVYEP
jgi:hypothetical protein